MELSLRKLFKTFGSELFERSTRMYELEISWVCDWKIILEF